MNIDLIANIVICGLFFMLGLFVSTVIAEKRNFRLKENQMKEKISAAGGAGRSKEDAAEFERLHAEIARYADDLKAKDREIEKLFEQVSRTTEEHRKTQEKLSAAAGAPQRSKEDMAELERLRAEVTGQLEAIQTKDREIGKLIEQVNRTTEEHHKVREQMLAGAGGNQRSKEDTAELERLRAEVASQLDAMKLKDAEIAKLIDQVERGTDDNVNSKASSVNPPVKKVKPGG
ncbi:MAG: hypothetical protein PHN49_03200 [Candidatus Omnitrophica bacterium]|nr:hypothetical protein [Candidatus Omnitrophota bacterium]MDD5670627.1 hypothetical protein [Candidatus Omnitrophota bacterium]